MPLTEVGYAFALDLLTDPTDGINKVSIFTNLSEKTKQTVNFSAATSTANGGQVVMSDTELLFDISAGEIVQAVGLYHDTTYVGLYQFPSQFNFTSAGVFTLTGLTITLD